jgi:hypothetical protein
MFYVVPLKHHENKGFPRVTGSNPVGVTNSIYVYARCRGIRDLLFSIIWELECRHRRRSGIVRVARAADRMTDAN